MPEQETIKINRSGGRHDSCIFNFVARQGEAHTVVLYSVEVAVVTLLPRKIQVKGNHVMGLLKFS